MCSNPPEQPFKADATNTGLSKPDERTAELEITKLTSKYLKEFQEREERKHAARREADPAWQTLQKLEDVSGEIEQQFLELRQSIDWREQVGCSNHEQRYSTMCQERLLYKDLRAKIALRNSIFEDLQRLHTSDKTQKLKLVDPEKDDVLPQDVFYTHAKSVIFKEYMTDERFGPVRDEIEDLFGLLAFQAKRYEEIRAEKEKKIVDQELKFWEYKRELKNTRKELKLAREERKSLIKRVADLEHKSGSAVVTAGHELGGKSQEACSLGQTLESREVENTGLSNHSDTGSLVTRSLQVQDIEQETTQATETRDSPRTNIYQYENTIKKLKYRLEHREKEIKRLSREVTDLARKTREETFGERR
jgi:hypothetical protein